MKFQDNRIELDNWFIQITANVQRRFVFVVHHKTDGRRWTFYTLQEAIEALDNA